MDVLATDLADYLVRKGVSSSLVLFYLIITSYRPPGPLPGNSPYFRTRSRLS